MYGPLVSPSQHCFFLHFAIVYFHVYIAFVVPRFLITWPLTSGWGWWQVPWFKPRLLYVIAHVTGSGVRWRWHCWCLLPGVWRSFHRWVWQWLGALFVAFVWLVRFGFGVRVIVVVPRRIWINWGCLYWRWWSVVGLGMRCIWRSSCPAIHCSTRARAIPCNVLNTILSQFVSWSGIIPEVADSWCPASGSTGIGDLWFPAYGRWRWPLVAIWVSPQAQRSPFWD